MHQKATDCPATTASPRTSSNKEYIHSKYMGSWPRPRFVYSSNSRFCYYIYTEDDAQGCTFWNGGRLLRSVELVKSPEGQPLLVASCAWEGLRWPGTAVTEPRVSPLRPYKVSISTDFTLNKHAQRGACIKEDQLLMVRILAYRLRRQTLHHK